ncbi:MAG: hypothetical protein QFX36_03220 [Archaeoglobales archaeon]|nr:hypothetical protein [Archaeoglobales archaeon]
MEKVKFTVLVTVAVVIFFLPLLTVYCISFLFENFTGKERYSNFLLVYVRSYEQFNNVSVFIPTVMLGSEELKPLQNFEVIEVDNRTYLKILLDKPIAEMSFLYKENRSVLVYFSDLVVNFPKKRIENLSEYKIGEGEYINVQINFTNASNVEFMLQLSYLETRYLDLLGYRIYLVTGHNDVRWCGTGFVRINESEKNIWLKIPVNC